MIIGVETYRDRAIPGVQYARADAVGMAAALREECGFGHIRVLAGGEGEAEEPTCDHVVDALLEFAEAVREGDHFLLAFSGHGAELEGHSYLMLADTRQVVPEVRSLPLRVLWRFLERLPARWCSVVLDCCRNDPTGPRGDGGGRLTDAFYRDLQGLGPNRAKARRMTSILTACKAGGRAYAWEAFGHGVCSHFLLEGIRERAWTGGRLTFVGLASYACDAVTKWSETAPGLRERQEPWFQQWGDAEEVTLARRAVAAGESGEAVAVEEDGTAGGPPLPPGGWSWHHGAAGHRSRLAGLVQGRVRVEGLELDWPEAGWLVGRGVAEVEVRAGGMVARAGVEALIAARQTGLLRVWLQALPVVDPVAGVVAALLEGDLDRLEEQLVRVKDEERRLGLRVVSGHYVDADGPQVRIAEKAWAEARFRPVLARCFGRLWQRPRRVVEWLDSWSARTPALVLLVGEWIQHAGMAGEALGGHAQVGKLGGQAGLLARVTEDWVGVARVLGRHVGNGTEARNLIQRGESEARTPRDWSACAVAWAEVLGEQQAARRCAARAEEAVREAMDWIAVAEARAAGGHEGVEVREALERAAVFAAGSAGRVDLAEAWWRLLRDRECVVRSLVAGEAAALEATDWFLLALRWETLLGETKHATRCLEQGARMAAGSFDWQACGRTGQRLGVGSDLLEECVERAAHAAETAEDWCWVGAAAREVLADAVASERHLGRAWGLARSVEDWLCVARVMADELRRARALARAEEMAETVEDLLRVGEAWLRHQQDANRARGCLLRAERQVRVDEDWAECAQAWDRLFRDAEAHRRCVRQYNAASGAPRRPCDDMTSDHSTHHGQ